MIDSVQPAVSMTAVSYNIHSTVGRDGRASPDRILQILNSTGSSIIALQEVDTRVGNPAPVDQFEYFASHFDMEAIAGPNIVEHDGQYGNALLTSWPIECVRTIRLTVGHLEPRGAIVAVLRCDGRRLQVINTHLGLRPNERRQQIAMLGEEVRKFAGPTLFMGDFNIWNRRSRSLDSLGAGSAGTATPATFPARLPLFALDRIWATQSATMQSVMALRDERTSVASDHLPLVAKLHLAGRSFH
jgi:endonuclease/exonuclease/phosphatase family metal-dependent hydrolase